MLRRLSAKAAAPAAQRLARGQSTLSAHADGCFSRHLPPPTTSAVYPGTSWADDTEKWLANRRAAEYATDIMTAKQLSPFVSTTRSWKEEYIAWLDTAPAVAAKLASTSYAEAARPAARPNVDTWADETEIWLAQRRAAEYLCDKALVQEAVWFK